MSFYFSHNDEAVIKKKYLFFKGVDAEIWFINGACV